MDINYNFDPDNYTVNDITSVNILKDKQYNNIYHATILFNAKNIKNNNGKEVLIKCEFDFNGNEVEIEHKLICKYVYETMFQFENSTQKISNLYVNFKIMSDIKISIV